MDVIILSGGSGSRLWPSSRTSLPKQFIEFREGTTLFGDTVKRVDANQDTQFTIVSILGSVSYLEPYHAESTYGYSPYGWKIILERHGLKLLDCVPSIDGIALMIKHLCNSLLVPHDQAKLWELIKDQNIFHTYINNWDNKSKA